MNEATLRAQADRSRREFIRWILLLAANINLPTHSTLRFLHQVVQGEYPDATELEVRRALDYLESRDLVKIMTSPVGHVTADLTRYGIDVAEYTIDCEPGIARPSKL